MFRKYKEGHGTNGEIKRKTIEGLGGLFIVYEFDFKSNYQRVLWEGIV